jgi:hypothetical protein
MKRVARPMRRRTSRRERGEPTYAAEVAGRSIAFGIFVGDASAFPGFAPRFGKAAIEVVLVRLIVHGR